MKVIHTFFIKLLYNKKMEQIQTPKQFSNFTELLKGAWLLFASRFKTLVAIVLPPIVLASVILLWFWFGGSVWVLLAAVIAEAVLQLLSALALIKSISASVGFSDAYRYALKNFFSYLWFAVLVSCVILGGLLLGFVPGVIFSIWFMFGVYILVAENQKGMDALMRSKEYVRGYWWKVFWKLTLMSLLLSVLLTPVLLLLDKVHYLIANSAGFALSSLAGAFYAVFIYRLYQDLVSAKPEMANLPVSGKRGFFIFTAIIGLLFLVFVLWAFLSAALPFLLLRLNLG